MSSTWEYISINNCKVKMQVDTGADSTVMSSKTWTELGKPQLPRQIKHLAAYDGHQLTLLGSLSCDVERNGSRYTQNQLAVVQSDKDIGLLGGHLKHGVNNIITEHLPAVKGYKAHVKVILQSTANVLQSQNNTSTSSRQGQRENGTDSQTEDL